MFSAYQLDCHELGYYILKVLERHPLRSLSLESSAIPEKFCRAVPSEVLCNLEYLNLSYVSVLGAAVSISCALRSRNVGVILNLACNFDDKASSGTFIKVSSTSFHLVG